MSRPAPDRYLLASLALVLVFPLLLLDAAGRTLDGEVRDTMIDALFPEVQRALF